MLFSHIIWIQLAPHPLWKFDWLYSYSLICMGTRYHHKYKNCNRYRINRNSPIVFVSWYRQLKIDVVIPVRLHYNYINSKLSKPTYKDNWTISVYSILIAMFVFWVLTATHRYWGRRICFYDHNEMCIRSSKAWQISLVLAGWGVL